MNSKTLTTIATYTLLAGTVISALSMPRTLLGGVEAAEPEEAPATDVALIVMYGVDADTNQLLRYTFMNDEYEPVADLVTDDGQGLVDVEALAYIPDGEFKGMYCSPVAGSLQGHLCKIEVLTGMVSPRPQRTCGDGLRGMVAYETQPGKWRLLAACETTKELWLIHPASGQVTVLATLDQRYDGLAVDGNGVLYGATVSSLYKIDLTTFTETKIGDHGFSKVEALEFAFGDQAATIDVPDIPASWTENGMLLAFDDTSDSMLIMNPATGETSVQFSAFSTVDCEGIVLLTRNQDPLGFILTNMYD